MFGADPTPSIKEPDPVVVDDPEATDRFGFGDRPHFFEAGSVEFDGLAPSGMEPDHRPRGRWFEFFDPTPLVKESDQIGLEDRPRDLGNPAPRGRIKLVLKTGPESLVIRLQGEEPDRTRFEYRPHRWRVVDCGDPPPRGRSRIQRIACSPNPGRGR